MAKSVVREVKILDAVLKEDEGTEDEPDNCSIHLVATSRLKIRKSL